MVQVTPGASEGRTGEPRLLIVGAKILITGEYR